MTGTDERKHDRMVEYVTRHLKQRFYGDIRSRAEGFLPPARVDNTEESRPVVPDVTVVSRGTGLNVLKVETPATLRDADATHRWQTLARHTEGRGGRLWVVVPRGTGDSALEKLQSAAVDAKVWEVQPKQI